MEPNDAVQCRGAATLASAQHIAPAMPLNASAVDTAMTATSVLGVNAVTIVKAAMPVRPITTGILQLLIGDTPRADRKSVSQPAPTLPKTPQANGIAATQPVLAMLMWRSISR